MARQSDLYSRWSASMRRGRVFAAGEQIGIGVSGGPDSILLLSFACDLAKEIGICPSVVHFNHLLRGTESNQDEEFVAEAARDRRIRFLHARADVKSAARRLNKNLEATARALRYRYFFSLIRRGSVDRIATAHTANDQAETVLLRLFRGAGTRGLGGIFPSLKGGIIRPFLEITRAEVEGEIARRGLAFRHDSSNLDLRFTRNRIRKDLLPRLEREYNPGIVRLLAALAARARDDDAYLEQQASEVSRPWRLRDEVGERISTQALARLPASLERRVLRQMIEGAGGAGRVTAHQIEDLRDWARRAQSGRTLTLAGNIEAHREFDWLLIRPAASVPASASQSYSMIITPPAQAAFPGGSITLRTEDLPTDSAGHSTAECRYNSNDVVYIDMDKLTGEIVLRNWQNGDRLCPLGSNRAKKLKELFLERRIPASRRRAWPVLASCGQVVWARGLGVDRRFAADRSTRRALIIEGALA